MVMGRKAVCVCGEGGYKDVSRESELIDSGMDVRRLLPKLL